MYLTFDDEFKSPLLPDGASHYASLGYWPHISVAPNVAPDSVLVVEWTELTEAWNGKCHHFNVQHVQQSCVALLSVDDDLTWQLYNIHSQADYSDRKLHVSL